LLITNKKIASGGRLVEDTLQGNRCMKKVEKHCAGSIPAYPMCAFWWTNTLCAWADLVEILWGAIQFILLIANCKAIV